MRIPTREKLVEAFNEDEGGKVYDVLKGTTPATDYPSAAKLERAAYNPPDKRELKMLAASDILGGFGTEAVFEQGEQWPALVYINMGDTYTTTLLYDAERDRISIGTMGDWVEENDPDEERFQ